nr:protein FAM216B isoform X2 [Phascolarctos cinereus]
MNQNKKKHVAFCYPVQIPSKQIRPSPRQPVSSFFLNPAVLKGLNPSQQRYLNSIAKVYDSKPQRKNLKWQYILSLLQKYNLGYISKKDAMSYVTAMDQYTKKGPVKYRSKNCKSQKTPTFTSSRKSLSSHVCPIIKHCC